MPEAFIVHILRFKVGKNGSTCKVAETIKFGLEEFFNGTKLALCAVIEHVGGTLEDGYYIAYKKYNERWWQVKNEEVRLVEDEEDVLAAQGYLLFYR